MTILDKLDMTQRLDRETYYKRLDIAQRRLLQLRLHLALIPFILLLRLLEQGQRLLPAALQFLGDQSVIRVSAVVLPAGQIYFVAKPLQMALLGAADLLGLLITPPLRLLVYVQFDRREGLEKRLHHIPINRLGEQMLAGTTRPEYEPSSEFCA